MICSIRLILPCYLIFTRVPENTRTINTDFIQFFLGVARLTIYQSRHIVVFENKEIDTNKLMNNILPLFNKYVDANNPLIRFQNDPVQRLP